MDRIELPTLPDADGIEIASKRKSVVEDAILIFTQWAEDKQGWRKEVWETAFNFGVKTARELGLGIRDAKILLEAEISGIFGFFISGVLSEVLRDETNLSVRTKTSMAGIGYKMERGRIEVRGSRHIYFGYKMRGGELILHGDAGNYAGAYMEGGTLIVRGNVRNWAGYGMKGGTMVVEGNAGDATGSMMRGGTIVIHGSAGEWLGEGAESGEIKVLRSLTNL